MPLNELKRVYPEIYREHVKKYAGREELLKFKIPIWSCLWNDVLHMAAVPPKKLDKAFKEAEADLKWRRWFKISPKLLNLSNTIVYLYKKRPFNADSSEFVPFRINDLKKYNSLGQRTRDYFREETLHGRSPLIFHLVPHILYKGKLKLSDLEVTEI